jgi:hypothetical protein
MPVDIYRYLIAGQEYRFSSPDTDPGHLAEEAAEDYLLRHAAIGHPWMISLLGPGGVLLGEFQVEIEGEGEHRKGRVVSHLPHGPVPGPVAC